MTISLSSELEAVLKDRAQRLGTTPEALAVRILQEMLGPVTPPPFEPRDDWERLVLAAGTNCGVVVSPSALTSDGLYD
jgi:hypothetical protein